MSWFNRHTDLTLVSTWILICVSFPVAFAAAGYVPGNVDRFQIPGWFSLYCVVAFIFALTVSGWFLCRKKRSLSWLALLVIPLGWLGLLLLYNRDPAYYAEDSGE